MLNQFVAAAGRLFSSKTNGAKQVALLTDSLHGHKLLALSLSIFIMLGYSQFRAHFKCQPVHGIDAKVVTDFCWNNGTVTVLQLADGPTAPDSDSWSSTHVGHNFYTSDQRQRLVGHNYMRSLWALLLLLALCSYLARRHWASLFKDDTLRALLKLHSGEQDKPALALAAERAQAYELLADCCALQDDGPARQASEPQAAPRSERLARSLELAARQARGHDEALAYYANQLAYLLLARAARPLPCRGLRRRLLLHSAYSSLLSGAQFALPLAFIGREYAAYGWRFASALAAYLWRLAASDVPILDNSVDYQLSSSIFPTSVACNYAQFGMSGGTENSVAQCTVSINEICAKLFVVIWWLVVLHLAAELWTLLVLALSSLSRATARCSFGLRCWPNARHHADLIVSFGRRRAALLRQRERRRRLAGAPTAAHKSASLLHLGPAGFESAKLAHSEGRQEGPAAGEPRRLDKRWYHFSPHDICSALANSLRGLVCWRAHGPGQTPESEPELDINLYYLLYLIHLRLGQSKSLTEELIRMTGSALNNHLDDLEAHEQFELQRGSSPEAQVDGSGPRSHPSAAARRTLGGSSNNISNSKEPDSMGKVNGGLTTCVAANNNNFNNYQNNLTSSLIEKV